MTSLELQDQFLLEVINVSINSKVFKMIAKQTCWLVVESVVEDGRKFRPSDWVERISTTLAKFGPDHRLHYNQSVRPTVINGEKCLMVDKTLEEQDPQAFKYILDFVHSNRLRMHETCTD